MKKLTLILASVLGISLQSMAHGYGYSYVNSYADAIVFDEMGVTFSVYPDGEFDFYLDNGCHPNTVSNGYVNVTFNSGYNYDPYVQYDDYGAVVQVENVPIYYDWYGRVSQIGDVVVSYRNRRVCQVGGLYLHYNSYGHYAYHTGYVNVWNPYFVYRPFYVAFARPVVNLCFVRTTPYRQYYRPVRYTYYRPYVRNVRPHYATIGHTYSPSGNVVTVHHRYSQTAGKGEVAVVRDRRKVTNADASPRSRTVQDARTSNVRNSGSTYGRSAQATKPATARTSSDVNRSTSQGTRSTSASRTSNTRQVQTAPSRTSSSRVNTAAKPASNAGRTATASSRTGAVQPSSRNTNSSRSVSQSSAPRTSSVQKPTSSRSTSSSSRSVKPQTSSRSSAAQTRTSSKPSSSASRSSSRSTVSKGSSSSSKSGGKVSVGNRSSKSGR